MQAVAATPAQTVNNVPGQAGCIALTETSSEKMILVAATVPSAPQAIAGDQLGLSDEDHPKYTTGSRAECHSNADSHRSDRRADISAHGVQKFAMTPARRISTLITPADC